MLLQELARRAAAGARFVGTAIHRLKRQFSDPTLCSSWRVLRCAVGSRLRVPLLGRNFTSAPGFRTSPGSLCPTTSGIPMLLIFGHPVQRGTGRLEDLLMGLHQPLEVNMQVQQAIKKANGMLAFIVGCLEYRSRDVLLQLYRALENSIMNAEDGKDYKMQVVTILIFKKGVNSP
eukprot:g44577.t1